MKIKTVSILLLCMIMMLAFISCGKSETNVSETEETIAEIVFPNISI